MPTTVYDEDYTRADGMLIGPTSVLRNVLALCIAMERERCATIALEQRCERNTPWDGACVAIAKAIRAAPERLISAGQRQDAQ